MIGVGTMRLVEAREIAGLSQQEVANKAHVSMLTVSRMENGHRVMKNSFLLVCEALGVDPKTITDVVVTSGFRGRRF